MNEIKLLSIIAGIWIWGTGVAQGVPPPRHLERIAYDIKRNKLIMYGGAASVAGELVAYSSVYEWDKNGWVEFAKAGPGGRNGGALVYNSKSNRTYLLGGVSENKNGYTILFDVWTWDGDAWQRLDLECPVKEPDAVYDPSQNRILAYGEVSNKTQLIYDGGRKFELWSLKENVWQKLSDSGPVMSAGQLVFDTYRSKLVIPMATQDKMTIWEWSDNAWSEKKSVGASPLARSRFSAAYDQKSRATVVHGGRSVDRKFLNDLWQWDGSQWKEVTPPDAQLPKASARMVVCPDGILEYGGAIMDNNKVTSSNEVWSLTGGSWKKLN